MALPGYIFRISTVILTGQEDTYVHVDAVEEVIRRKHKTSLRSSGSGVRHDLRSDVLFQV